MRTFRKTWAGALTLVVTAMPAATETIAWKARDITWEVLPPLNNAYTAALWNDASGQGAIHRLPINQPLNGETGEVGLRVVIILGGLSVEAHGDLVGEYGPGSFVSIPLGTRYALTATAAGECTFLLMHSATTAAETVAQKARSIAWEALPPIKDAYTTALWKDAVGQGAIHRLPINQPLSGGTGAAGLRAVIMLGALSVDVDGELVGEYGPGSFVSIPHGARFALTATAAGECTFLILSGDPSAQPAGTN